MLRKALLVAAVAVIIYKLMNVVIKAGVFTHYKKHYPGPCRQIKGLNYGSEDLEVTKDGLAFITSGVSYAAMSTGYKEFLQRNGIKGRIFLYDFNEVHPEARELQLVPSKDFNPDYFHPHGISILEDSVKGEHIIYVINHAEIGDEAVEKFKFLPESYKLLHLKSFRGPLMHITNDLAIIGEDQFYISDYLYFKDHTLSLIEQAFLPFGLGSLLYFNGSDFSVVDSGLFSPNGMTLSKDKRYLYLSLPALSTVNVYELEKGNSLVLIQSAYLHSMADNLHLSESGDALYSGAHPILHQLVVHLDDPRQPAPSSVLRLPLKDGKIVPEDITELFYDHGDLISASSCAAIYKNKLLIGSVINKLVVCDVNADIV
ncbi:unnamed protein product [Candidula unifasciata]|uniref:Paraoxonase n=1 Tax=Candidula unifasciata TaxID=100452 RepID=A0A8S4A5B6_9EUPU|nr:unnamed protein product [Candidula unifasciata]